MIECGQFQVVGAKGLLEKAVEYFGMLDKDQDHWVSFFDFLAPLLPLLPPEVATIFTSESLFKSETFQQLRQTFDDIKLEVNADGSQDTSLMFKKFHFVDL